MKMTAINKGMMAAVATTLLLATQWITTSVPTLAQEETRIQSELKRFNLVSDALTKSAIMNGPDGDFSIWMPGQITQNTSEALASYSSATSTTYGMLHFDLNSSVRGMSEHELSELVYDLVSGFVNQSGVVVDSQEFEIDGVPVWEVTAVEADGRRAKHRLLIRGRRVYYRYAITATRFSDESYDFFRSFRLSTYQVSYP